MYIFGNLVNVTNNKKTLFLRIYLLILVVVKNELIGELIDYINRHIII